MTDKVLENLCRRRATRVGLYLRKSRAKRLSVDNRGEYMLIELDHNAIVAGQRFDLSLSDVVEWLDEYEQRLHESRSKEEER